MPCLVIFKLAAHTHPSSSLEAWDVVSVLKAGQSPGTSMEGESPGYGFFYITDRTPQQIRKRFMEPLYGEAEVGADPSDFPMLKRRRRNVKVALMDEEGYRKWRPYSSPGAVKVSMTEVNANHTNEKS